MDCSRPVALLEARGITKSFPRGASGWSRIVQAFLPRAIRQGSLPALHPLDFDLTAGESVGIMGPNGAGKTTLLRILMGTIVPTSGAVVRRGRIGMLDLGGAMNPDLSGRENVLSMGLALGLTRSQILDRLEAIISFAELEHAIDDPQRTYSSGMSMRLGFSLNIHAPFEAIIIDEAFAVGDARFVLKCVHKLHELRKRDVALIFSSHDANAISELCDRALLLDRGEVTYQGDPVATGDAYHALVGLHLGSNSIADYQETQPSSESIATFLEGATVRRPDPSPRAVEILGAKLLRNGAPCSGSFDYGDECEVQWALRVRRAVDCLTSGIHIHSRMGTYVFGTSYVHLGRPIRVSGPTVLLLAIRFPVWLGPGEYTISFGAAEPDLSRHAVDGVQLDRFRYALELRVRDFALAPGEPIPFFGTVHLSAQAADPVHFTAEAGSS